LFLDQIESKERELTAFRNIFKQALSVNPANAATAVPTSNLMSTTSTPSPPPAYVSSSSPQLPVDSSSQLEMLSQQLANQLNMLHAHNNNNSNNNNNNNNSSSGNGNGNGGGGYDLLGHNNGFDNNSSLNGNKY
jgi:hypothetical protein